MTHPTPAELLDLHFGEAPTAKRARLAAHAQACTACRNLLDDVAWAESLLRASTVEAPPDDGLERVLSRVRAARPAPPGTSVWRSAAPSAAAVLALGLAVLFGGASAGLAVVAGGTLVTLSLAPILILESQKRGAEAAAR